MLTAIISVVLVLGLGVIFVIVLYNNLVRGRNQVEEAYSNMDVQLKRRHDLIPMLVSTVKGYASHENKTLEEVISARNIASDTSGKSVNHEEIQNRMKAESGLTSALRSLFAVSENYPDLKASTNFLQLQEELSEIEENIQMARRYYNGTAREQNNRVQVFPGNIIASMFAFMKTDYFELDDAAEKNAPKVEF